MTNPISRKRFRWAMQLMWLSILLAFAFMLARAPTAFAKPRATIVVNTAADNGPGNCATTCTMRDAITAAASGDTINFDGNYTIALASQLTINKNLTIDGARHTVIVSGNNAVRVFYVNAGVTLTTSTRLPLRTRSLRTA